MRSGNALLNALVYGLIVGIVVALIIFVVGALTPLNLDPTFWGMVAGILAALWSYLNDNRRAV